MAHAQLTGSSKAAATRAANAEAAKQAQLKQARAEVRARKKAERDAQAAAAAHAQAQQPEPAAAPIESLFDDTMQLPSWKRVVVGLVLGLVAAGGVGYGIGMIMAYCLAGIATLTAGAAMTFVLSALVWIIGIYASWKIGGWVGGKVFGSVVLPEGLASRSFASLAGAVTGAKDRASGWVKTPLAEHADNFTGAYTKGRAA